MLEPQTGNPAGDVATHEAAVLIVRWLGREKAGVLSRLAFLADSDPIGLVGVTAAVLGFVDEVVTSAPDPAAFGDEIVRTLTARFGL